MASPSYVGRSYGALACLQGFRSADVGERFERQYHLLHRQLSANGYEFIAPTYFGEARGLLGHIRDQPPSAIRCAWKKSGQSAIFIGAGLPVDGERYDYVGYVISDTKQGLESGLIDLHAADHRVVQEAASREDVDNQEGRRSRKRSEVAHLRSNIKEFALLSGVPIAGNIAVFFLPMLFTLQMSGALELVRTIFNWVLTIFVALTVLLTVCYAIKLLLVEANILVVR